MDPYRQPRRRSGGRIALIVAGIVVAVLCVCGGGFGFLMYKTISAASEAPRAATHAFVADLAAGNTTAAYDKLCTRSRGRYSPSQFADAVAGQPRPTKAKITGFSVSGDTAEIQTTLTLADGASRGQEFRLAKEGGAWKVCGSPY
jgi:F0F1-type ATP synthase membrane subunit c/vacuolar-type H+-ATPase subunit K